MLGENKIRGKTVTIVFEMLALDKLEVERRYHQLHENTDGHLNIRKRMLESRDPDDGDVRYMCDHGGYRWSFVDHRYISPAGIRDTAMRKFLMWDAVTKRFKSQYERDLGRLTLNDLM